MSDSQLTSFFPGSAKHFLIKTIDKNSVDSRIIDKIGKEGSDYSSGGGDPCPNPRNPDCSNQWGDGSHWQDPSEPYYDCGCLCTRCE